ncbi:MAG: IS1595 family transposase [Sphingomonas sp.]|nr:IS1595 family transposase [Sphingomonas sp.]
MSVLSKPYFHDEAKAFEYLESVLWSGGIVCPHCGVVGGRVYELKGKTTRVGLKKCGECRQQFTVKVGTVFEHGRMPLNKMLQAVYLMTCSKKGISAHQLHRTLEISYKAAWFLAHRIREAMRSGDLAPFGGEGGVVEVDETFIGRKQGVAKPRGGQRHMIPVLSLVHRESGQCRSFVVDKVTRDELVPIVLQNVDRETYIMTDESGVYKGQFRKLFLGHGVVNHTAGEYGRGRVHTNTVEGSFSIFKRGMKGVYQHCSEKHLHRYVAEFEFRYNNRHALGCDDSQRAAVALKGLSGKRLTYVRAH